jgi:hypothetical protein
LLETEDPDAIKSRVGVGRAVDQTIEPAEGKRFRSASLQASCRLAPMADRLVGRRRSMVRTVMPLN